MKLRHPWILCMMLGACSPGLRADETNDKLDTILKEIQSLQERVGRLEQQVQSLQSPRGVKSRHRAPQLPALTPSIPTIQNPGLHATPEAVIRLQGDSPGLLIKRLHERERILRKRQFPADYARPWPFR